MIGGLESVKAGDEFPEADVVDGVDDVAAIVVAAAVVVGHFLNCLKSLTTCFEFALMLLPSLMSMKSLLSKLRLL